MAIPVYVFTGFLDAGKSSFIQETLEDPQFNAGERTLLLVCEEGEFVYQPERFPKNNVFIEIVEDQDELTEEDLERMCADYGIERVCIELNGMQLISDFYQKFPKEWVPYQEIMFADAGTFTLYNANMRSLMVDKLSGCEMIVFNRVSDSIDRMELHTLVRQINRKCDIAYEDMEGNTEFDDIEDPLPFDLDADLVEIGDQDYGIFYADLNDDLQKYDGKKIRFLAQVAQTKDRNPEWLVPGRMVMTCCVEDIQFLGMICYCSNAADFAPRDWVEVTAEISIEENKVYDGVGPVLRAVSVVPAEAPAQDVVTF